MNRVDLHPEELLDAWRRGAVLAPADRSRLQEHLDACDPCAFERAVVEDFARELDREDPADDAAAAAAAAGALADRRVGPGPEPARRIRWAGSRRRFRLLLVAAVLLAAAVGAAAAAWYALVVIARRDSGAATPAACPPGSSGLAGSTVFSSPAAGTRGPGGAAPDPAPAGPSSPSAAEPVPAVEPVRPPPSRPPARPAVEPAPNAGTNPDGDAASLFSRANAARRSRDYGVAAAAYGELGRLFPGSLEELLSRVTYGTLLLEVLGQPQRALGLFDSYLAAARGGTMAEEALVGRALALGRLGRTDEERAAWHALLAEFPESTHADRARRRIEALP
ncbi:MAG: zf-HC2 domain-containing protein [Deltaproteobacteria bacterium]|nr:zf-HC2 domain-containing protein [Deltaproteobacteria bacterium]